MSGGMMHELMDALSAISSPIVIAYIVFGVFIGYIVGALPGMNRATAIALLMPFTFAMQPLVAISFLIGINKGGAAGGAVSAILINVPGEPSAVVTTLDGYPMARAGRARKALKIAIVASVFGDVLATIALIALAQPLARFAIGIGPVELTAILIFALTFIAAVSGKSFLRGLIAGILGLLAAMPGLDSETGLPRLTFGMINLYDGIPLLAIAIGTLALSEVMVQIEDGWENRKKGGAAIPPGSKDENRLSGADILKMTPNMARASLIGIMVGIIPGLGATLSSFLAYTAARRASRDPDSFGRGNPQGVAAAEAADNASVPASLVPMFALGLPGSISTALLMGAFLMHGMTPGPFLFRDDAELVYGIFLGMIVASFALLVVGFGGLRFFAWIITARETVVLPIIVFLCFLGAYLEGGGMFSVYLMLGFALLGYFMKKMDYSFVTFLIGFILGPMTELSLRQALILSDGRPAALLDHPVAIAFLFAAVISVWRFGRLHMLETRGEGILKDQQETKGEKE